MLKAYSVSALPSVPPPGQTSDCGPVPKDMLAAAQSLSGHLHAALNKPRYHRDTKCPTDKDKDGFTFVSWLTKLTEDGE